MREPYDYLVDEKIYWERVGKNLRIIREKHHLTCDEVADRTFLEQGRSLSNYEKGEAYKLSLRDLHALAITYHCKIDDFLVGCESGRPPKVTLI